MMNVGIISLSLLLVGVVWAQNDVQVPTGLTFPSQTGTNTVGFQNNAAIPGLGSPASDPFATSSSSANNGFNFASGAEFPSIGAASGANNPDFPTLGISGSNVNTVNGNFPTVGGGVNPQVGGAPTLFGGPVSTNGFPQPAGPILGGQDQFQSWSSNQNAAGIQTSGITMPGMGPTQPVNALFPGAQNTSPFGSQNVPGQMNGVPATNPGMNQGMNQGMNPGMPPTFTGFRQQGQQVNPQGAPQQGFPQPTVPGFSQPGSPMFNTAGQQGMSQTAMSLQPGQPQFNGQNTGQTPPAQSGVNQPGFQAGMGPMMGQQGQSMGGMGNNMLQTGAQGVNPFRNNMPGFNTNPNLPPRELRCHQETCPTGTQCTLYDPRGDFMCPRWIPILPCTCRPGCQVENLFIRAGMRRNVDRCGSYCDCDTNGQTNCTYFQCPGANQDQMNQQTQNQQTGK